MDGCALEWTDMSDPEHCDTQHRRATLCSLGLWWLRFPDVHVEHMSVSALVALTVTTNIIKLICLFVTNLK